MSSFKYATAAVALASGAHAALCSTSGTMTMTNSADAANIAACSTFSGSIAVATAVSDIALDGPERITGNLIVKPNGLISTLSADNLRIIDGTFSLSQLAQITSLSMPELTEVANFYMSALGQDLLSLDLTHGVTQVNMLTVDNTFLTNVDGINLKTAESVTVTNNELLTDFTMPIKNVTGAVTIRGNTKGLNVGLSELESSGNLLVNDCSQLNLASFVNSTGAIAFSENSFTTLSMPNLTTASQGLAILSNSHLKNISFPLLDVVGGGLDVENNTDITGTISFPKLKAAQSMAFVGFFSGVSMPALIRVPGKATFASTKDISSTCSKYQDDVGTLACDSSISTASASATTGLSAASATSTHHNAGFQYGPSAENVYTIFGGLAALFSLFM